jgi:hypothetical protein
MGWMYLPTYLLSRSRLQEHVVFCSQLDAVFQSHAFVVELPWVHTYTPVKDTYGRTEFTPPERWLD